jgi:CubicO group peptidase (beta-lactamase class C family)
LLSVQVLFAGLHLEAAAGQDSSQYKEAIEQFEAFVQKQMKADHVVGMAVGFMKGDYTWTKGFGYADLENKTAMTAQGSFRMASITKTFTAVAVLQLVEQGKIDLDAEVQTYVPYFPRKKWPVTVRLLLGHLGGITHYKNYAREGHIREHKDTKEALAIFQDFDLVAEPGTRYHYSSYGFNLLGAVVEGASGKSFGEYIDENIFKPLGMQHSHMDDPVDLISNRVRGYRMIGKEIKNSEYVNMSSRFAGGGTRSTVGDLLKFARGMMDYKLVKDKTIDRMWTSMATRGGRFTGYGMGWRVTPWYGYFRAGHGGSQQETRTYLLILPESDFILAVGCNTEGTDLAPYLNRLAELIIPVDTGAFDAFVKQRELKPVLIALRNIFLYGLSYYQRHGTALTTDRGNLKKAFDFFNTNVNERALKKDLKGFVKKIGTGVHPSSERAFTVVGSHMAAALAEKYGKENLLQYPAKSPLLFFHDYMHLKRKTPRFTVKMKALVSRWHKEWKRTYSDDVRGLEIMEDSDFKKVGRILKPLFARAGICPDISAKLLRTAFRLLNNDRVEKCMEVLDLTGDLYPGVATVESYKVYAALWENTAKSIALAKQMFKQAHRIEPGHYTLSPNWLRYFADRFEADNKKEALEGLVSIALEIHPENPVVHKDVGDFYLKTGRKKEALKHYQKSIALEMDIQRVKDILNALEKVKKK